MHYTAEQLVEMQAAYAAEFIMACVKAKVKLPTTEDAAHYFRDALSVRWAMIHWTKKQNAA